MKAIKMLCIQICMTSIAIVFSMSPASAMKWECGERSNLPQEGKIYCATGDFRLAETNLENVLNTLLAVHKSKFGNIDSLNASQAAFRNYRNNQCIAENQRVNDKPYYLMIVAQCKTRLTNLRIIELKTMLKKDR